MVRGIANSKIGFGDLILLLRYFFKLKVSTHPILENRKLSNFILLDTKVKSTKIYIKTTIINPLFEVVEKTKNKEGRIQYKCKVLPKDETSYLNREVSLEPFNLQKN